MQWAQKHKGFTIVELLIVIVVIAILAAMTIVAYNGIADRAKHSSAQSLTSQVTKKIEAYAVENSDQYPADLETIGITDPTPRKYQYLVNNNSSPRTYCVTITVQNVSYYQNNSTARNPTVGACSGHGLNGLPPNLAVNPGFETAAAPINARTNLAMNPSFESATSGWSLINTGVGASLQQSPDQAHSGTRSLAFQYGDSTTQDQGPTSSFYVNAGTPYTVSAWVYMPTTIGTGLRMILHGSTLTAGTERGTVTTTVGSWARISHTATPATSGTLSFTIAKNAGANDNGKLFYVDSVLAEAAPSMGTYFMGASAASGDFSYAWTGAAQVSTSQERADNIANYQLNGSGGARFQSKVRKTEGTAAARVLITTNGSNPGLYQNMSLQPGTYTFISKVWSTDEMFKERKCNHSNGAGYGLKYCYRDTSDMSTLEFWVIHKSK